MKRGPWNICQTNHTLKLAPNSGNFRERQNVHSCAKLNPSSVIVCVSKTETDRRGDRDKERVHGGGGE